MQRITRFKPEPPDGTIFVMSGWYMVYPGLWLVLIAGLLRFIGLGSEAVWYDESFTAWIARLDFGRMMEAIRGDVHPPLWYVIEWVNIRIFGSSEFALRLPPALFGVLAVYLVYRLALALGFQRGTAFVAGLLAAVLPAGGLYYSQDARMYPLLACCVLLALLGAIAERWWWFIVGSVGAMFSQNLGVFYVAALLITFFITRMKQPEKLLPVIRATGWIVVIYGIWTPTLFHQMQAVKSGFWIQPLTPGGALWTLPYMTFGWRIPDNWQIHIYGLMFGLTIVGLVSSRQWLFTRNGAFYFSIVIGAPVLIALVSVVWRSIYLPRAMLPSILALMLAWAYPLRHLSRPNRRVLQAVTVPALALCMVWHYAPPFNGRFDIRAWANEVKAQWQRDDVLYYISIDSAVLMSYYMHPRPYALLPEATDLNQSLSADTKAAMGMIERPLDSLRQHYQRAWVFATHNPMTSRMEIDEISRILATYQCQTFKADGNEYSSQTIYLCQL